MGKTKDVRHPAYISLLLKAKATGLCLVEFILLQEVLAGKQAPQSFGGLGFSQKLIQHHFAKLEQKGYLQNTDGKVQITDEGLALFNRTVNLPWHDNDDFWETWNLWIEYRKEKHNSVYTPISEAVALRSLVKWTDGNVETAIEGLLWTIGKTWQGFDYGIKEYLKSQQPESSRSGRHSPRHSGAVDASRGDVLEQIVRRNQS